MKITATFTGKTSLDYKTGETYELQLANFRAKSIQKLDGTGVCIYQSLSGFLKNWTDVQVHNDEQVNNDEQ
jgi:hypothetical protein